MEGAEDLEVARERHRPATAGRCYGSDPVRYWAIRSATFGRDGAASEDALHERYERELANELGNLVSRTTAMIARYRDGELPAGPGSPEVAAKLDALHGEIPARLTAWELTGALEAIWEVVRELNRVVERSKPWELAKDEANAAELDRVLYDLADGVRSVAVALYAYLAGDEPGHLACARPRRGRRLGRRATRWARAGAHRAGAAALSARRARRRLIDTHAHLDACADPAGVVLERARAVGVTRVVTVGTGIDSSRAALRLADEEAGVYAVLGIHPHDADTDDAGRLGELRELLGHARAMAVGETGLDHFRDYAPRSAQRRLFEEQLELAADLELPVVIHSRAAAQDTTAVLSGFGGDVVLHCFSEPELLDVALDRGYYVSFAGNVTYPKAGALREAARQVSTDRILIGDG